MLDVIGPGSFNQAIVRRVGAGKHVLLADIEDVCVEDDHRPNLIGSTGKPRHSWIGSSKVAPLPRKRAAEAVPDPTAEVTFSKSAARRISRASASMPRLAGGHGGGLSDDLRHGPRSRALVVDRPLVLHSFACSLSPAHSVPRFPSLTLRTLLSSRKAGSRPW
jgi:hypothetical protein